MRLVQIARGPQRRIAMVDGSQLQLIEPSFGSVYELAWKALERHTGLVPFIETALSPDQIDYDAVYQGATEWRFLPAFDHPYDSAHCLVSGTGLTHKASAKNRAAMHTKTDAQTDAQTTDSFRMFQMGLDGGSPLPGQVGVQPEWFYKGDGSILRAHRDALTVPFYGEEGGEEPEIAGAYLISPDGKPYRIGMAIANEFSDHRMEKRNYLYLAPSKLRECSIGPELSIGEFVFENVRGSVSIVRDDSVIWSSDVWTGATNMSHSVANLEHHHFKYPAHRRPGDVHIHFFGADAFSFGEGINLQSRDLMEVSFPDFGRPLRNYVAIDAPSDVAVTVEIL